MPDTELKTCPFCGGSVLFEHTFALYNRRITGKCLGCGMEFSYQERHEENTLEQRNGDLPVVTHLKTMKAMNAPFDIVWNSRQETPDSVYKKKYDHALEVIEKMKTHFEKNPHLVMAKHIPLSGEKLPPLPSPSNMVLFMDTLKSEIEKE